MMRLQRCTALKPISRSIYKKAPDPVKSWTKSQVDAQVFQVLYDYSKIPDDKVSLSSSLSNDLKLTKDDKFGMFLDLNKDFQLYFHQTEYHIRDWRSGKETADWYAFNLEMIGRLVDVE